VRVAKCSSALDTGTVLIISNGRGDFSHRLLFFFFFLSQDFYHELHDLPLKRVFFFLMKPRFSEVYKTLFVSALINFPNIQQIYHLEVKTREQEE